MLDEVLKMCHNDDVQKTLSDYIRYKLYDRASLLQLLQGFVLVDREFQEEQLFLVPVQVLAFPLICLLWFYSRNLRR
jgi:hypothetical protein